LTNNNLEAHNRWIKDHAILRSRCGLLEFAGELGLHMKNLSDFSADFQVQPKVQPNIWKGAQRLLQTKWSELLLNEGPKVFVLSTSALLSLGGLKQSELRRNLKTWVRQFKDLDSFVDPPPDMDFDEAINTYSRVYVLQKLREATGQKREIKYQCSCACFWKKWLCKHSIALSVLREGVEIPLRHSIATVGAYGKRGREKEMGSAYSMEVCVNKSPAGNKRLRVRGEKECSKGASPSFGYCEPHVTLQQPEEDRNEGVGGSKYCAYPECPGFDQIFQRGKRGHHVCSHKRCSLFVHPLCYNRYWSGSRSGIVVDVEDLSDLRCKRHAKHLKNT